MRILFIGSYKDRPTTGGHLYHLKMIEIIKRMGHEIQLVSVFQMPRFFRHRLTSFIYAFVVLVQKLPNLIIQVSDTALKYFLFSLVVHLMDVPTIQLVHHIENTTAFSGLKKRMIVFFMKFNLRYAKTIIVISDYTKGQVSNLLGPRVEKKIIIIRPKVDIECHPDIRRNYHNKKHWNFLSIGAINKRKGYAYLLEAFRELRDCSFKSYIVGTIEDKNYYNSLSSLIKRYDLEEKVNLTGYLSNGELRELYIKSDLFILPSLLEGYGIVFCEALCYGLPVLATNVGAIPEIISHGYNGLLFDPRSAIAIEKAIRMIISNPEIAERLAYNALEFCRCLGSGEEMQQNIEKFIKAIESGKICHYDD